MESRVNYTVVGFFVVLLTIAFLVLFFWLTTFRSEKVYNTYLAYFKEDVTGLSVESPVRYNGVPVGFVKKIQLDAKSPQLVRLVLYIEEGTPITQSTIAKLQFQGITGVLYVGLQTKTMNSPLLLPSSKEPYPVIPSQPSLFVQLGELLPNLAKNVDTLSKSIGSLLNTTNRKNFSTLLQNFATASKKFPDLTNSLSQAFVALSAGATQLGTTAKSFDVTAKSANEVMPSLQQMIYQAMSLASQLQTVASDLQQNPSILIRGKQAAPLGPGECK